MLSLIVCPLDLTNKASFLRVDWISSWPAKPKSLSKENFLIRTTRNLHRREMMSDKSKTNQPIYRRVASKEAKLAPASQKTTLDTQADEIRKAWLQRAPVRSA